MSIRSKTTGKYKDGAHPNPKYHTLILTLIQISKDEMVLGGDETRGLKVRNEDLTEMLRSSHERCLELENDLIRQEETQQVYNPNPNPNPKPNPTN